LEEHDDMLEKRVQ